MGNVYLRIIRSSHVCSLFYTCHGKVEVFQARKEKEATKTKAAITLQNLNA